MEYSTKVKRSHGVTEIRLIIRVSEEEITGVNKIADDVHCNVDTIKQHDFELSLAYARSFCYFVSLWNMKNKPKMIPHINNLIFNRKRLNLKPSKKKRRKK
ncbi:hypothetical protein [Yersinia phage vB_YenM_P744]